MPSPELDSDMEGGRLRMAWKSRLSGVRLTLPFVGIVAVVVTVTSVLAERGFIKPSDWELSASQWWGIVTAHFVNRSFDHYVGNMQSLLIFAGLFTVASMSMGTPHAREMRRKFDARLAWIVLGSAFFVSFLMWSIYSIAGRGSGMGTSAIVSSAFGAGTGLYLAMAMEHAATQSVPTESENGVGGKRLKARALFFMFLFVVLYLVLYGLLGSPPELVVHWLSYSMALFWVILRF